MFANDGLSAGSHPSHNAPTRHSPKRPSVLFPLQDRGNHPFWCTLCPCIHSGNRSGLHSSAAGTRPGTLPPLPSPGNCCAQGPTQLPFKSLCTSRLIRRRQLTCQVTVTPGGGGFREGGRTERTSCPKEVTLTPPPPGWPCPVSLQLTGEVVQVQTPLTRDQALLGWPVSAATPAQPFTWLSLAYNPLMGHGDILIAARGKPPF